MAEAFACLALLLSPVCGVTLRLSALRDGSSAGVLAPDALRLAMGCRRRCRCRLCC